MSDLDALLSKCFRCGSARPDSSLLASRWHGTPLLTCCNGPNAAMWIACRGCWAAASPHERVAAAIAFAEALARAADDDPVNTIVLCVWAVLGEAQGRPLVNCGEHE